MSLQTEISMARKIINEENAMIKNRKYNSYSPIHLKTTENIKDLFAKVNGSFDKSLVVTCGGDHALECIKHGAKVVDTFDINTLSKHALNLKLGAIRALIFEEFIHFYEEFDLSLYRKIRKCLTQETMIFFDALFMSYSADQVMFYLFDKLNHIVPNRINSSIFIKDGYYKIKENLSKSIVYFTESDLLDIASKKRRENYDFIYLSNILYYTKIPNFAQFLQNNIIPLLSKEGQVLVHYLYSGLLNFDDFFAPNGLLIAQMRLKGFCVAFQEQGLKCEQISIPQSGFGVGRNDINDIAISLKRTK